MARDRINVLRQLQFIIKDMYDLEKNEILKVPKEDGAIKSNTSPERIELIRRILYLVLETNYFSNVTKEHIKHLDIKMTTLANICFANTEKKPSKVYTESGLRGIIRKDKQKFEKDFGEEIFVNILEYKKNINKYGLKLTELLGKHMNKKSILTESILEIPDTDLYCTELTPQEFEQLRKALIPYSKSAARQVVTNEITERMLAYVKYISITPDLNETDKTRLDYLKGKLCD